MQSADPLVLHQDGFRVVRGLHGCVGGKIGKGVHPRVQRLDPLQQRAHQFNRRQLLLADQTGEFDGRREGERFAVHGGFPAQYVARPPETSNTAPVEKLHSSLASQQTSDVISSMPPNRPMGILDSIQSICCCVI